MNLQGERETNLWTRWQIGTHNLLTLQSNKKNTISGKEIIAGKNQVLVAYYRNHAEIHKVSA